MTTPTALKHFTGMVENPSDTFTAGRSTVIAKSSAACLSLPPLLKS